MRCLHGWAIIIVMLLCGAYLHAGDAKVKTDGTKTWIENVPSLAWGKTGETTFCGALNAFAQSRGVRTDYATLMGDSGLAFRLRWWRVEGGGPGWCPSSPVGEFNPWDERAAKSIGYKVSYRVHLDGKTDMSRYAGEVKVSIDDGRPALVYPTTFDVGLIYGYADDGKTVLVRDYFAPDKELSIELSKTKGLLGFLEPAGSPLDRREAATIALKAAVGDWRHGPEPIDTGAGMGRYLFGDAAYAEWIENLRTAGKLEEADQKKLFQPSWWTFCVLADARMQASVYLRSIAPLFEGEAKAAIERAAEIYGQSAAVLGPVFGAKDAFFGPWSGKSIADWTDAVRTREVAILVRSRELDAQAIAEIEKAIAAIG